MGNGKTGTRVGSDVHVGWYPRGADTEIKFGGEPENFAQNFHGLRGPRNSIIDPRNGGGVIDSESDAMVSPTRAPRNETMVHGPQLTDVNVPVLVMSPPMHPSTWVRANSASGYVGGVSGTVGNWTKGGPVDD